MSGSILSEILTNIRGRIQALRLPGIAPSNVLLQVVPGDRLSELPAEKYPCVLIAPHSTEGLEAAAGTNLRDDVVYPVRITLLAAGARDSDDRLLQGLSWRQTIRRAFHNQRLTATLCFTVRVQSLELIDRAAWSSRGFFMSSFVLHCHSREPRGVSTA